MSDPAGTPSDEAQIRDLLERWASATRQGRLDDVLANHAPDVLVYDVLPPMKYDGGEAYRNSWGDWHPEAPAEGTFELEDLSICAGSTVAFAHAFVQCGGALPDGSRFNDVVRATFCLRKTAHGWQVAHQHISKPWVLKPRSS